MLAFTADNGDRVSLRAEHNGARLVWRDGVPADPVFLHVPQRVLRRRCRRMNMRRPFFDDLTLRYEHAFNADWKVAAVVDYFLYADRWGWFTGWGYDGFQSVVFGNPVRARTANRSFDAQLRLNGRFETGFLAHTVFLGLEHWDYLLRLQQRHRALSRRRRSISSRPSIRRASVTPAPSGRMAWRAPSAARSMARTSSISTSNWRILIGGRYDLLAQRERVFDPFGALTGEPTSSLSKGVKGYISPARRHPLSAERGDAVLRRLRQVADPQHRRAHPKRRGAAAAAGHAI